MPSINCKVELKLKWTKYCVLSAAGADNANGDVNDNINGNNIIFTIKHTIYQFIVMNKKRKVRIKI